MNAMDELYAEHEAVRLALNILSRIGQDMDATGKIANVDDVIQLLDFLSTFVDRCHHGKEEQILFPSLEKVGVSCEGGPIGVMLEEHQKGRDIVSKMASKLSMYKSGDARAAREFKKYADDYIMLLNFHIDKENNVLFPMASKYLTEKKLAEIKKGFDRIETEKIGSGTHERFHVLLQRLERIYLN